jgi:phosphomannomutase
MATLLDTLSYTPTNLAFGTSGLRGLVEIMTDLECYINTVGFLDFLAHADNLPPKSAIYLGGDLRHSTPRIMAAVHQAITDAGHHTVNCGFVPTPAVAYYARVKNAPCIMVTGSHIPDDRNGIKFYKRGEEVLKEDELGINEAVAAVRERLYTTEAGASSFTAEGALVAPPALPSVDAGAQEVYHKRYTHVFDKHLLAGKKIVFYQHSSVGRDVIAELLRDLGAEVIATSRSDKFVPIDSENVTPDDRAYFKTVARDYPDAFAIVSTDGDADRPFVVDEHGIFHRGDVLGAVVADWLEADFAVYPVSASDAVDSHLSTRGVAWQHTKIGSPYVISVMDEAMVAGRKRVVGWEVNGGVLLGSDIQLGGKVLKALPTRDAFLPIIGALALAIKQKQSISQLFGGLPQRFTQAGLLDDFPAEIYRAMVEGFTPDTPENRIELSKYFSAEHGFGAITQINALDGVRIYFDNGDIAHLRQSSNAPQLRLYSVANTQERADEMVELAIAEPDGIFRRMQAALAKQ